MRITDKNYTITTIYFDGKFWCALIEQNRDGQNYAGRFKLNGKMVPSSLTCVFQENTY
ncbi:MAG: YjdF family protein [Treponema sp.]|nr:YjdF family protein [Treponema sp.]